MGVIYYESDKQRKQLTNEYLNSLTDLQRHYVFKEGIPSWIHTNYFFRIERLEYLCGKFFKEKKYNYFDRCKKLRSKLIDKVEKGCF